MYDRNIIRMLNFKIEAKYCSIAILFIQLFIELHGLCLGLQWQKVGLSNGEG